MSESEQKKIFSENLKRLLSVNGKTQAEVARYIKVSPQTFNTWIQGVALPRMGKVQALADYFRVKKSDLIDKQNSETRDYEDELINEYINIPKIRELILYAGGIEPGVTRDKYIEAVMTALKAMQEANKIG